LGSGGKQLGAPELDVTTAVSSAKSVRNVVRTAVWTPPAVAGCGVRTAISWALSPADGVAQTDT
jgi:hypothetical protein